MGRSAAKKRERRQAIISTERVGLGACPHCGAKLDAITGAGFDDEAPKIQPGDHTMCCYCLHVLQWDGSRHRKVPPAKEAEVFGQRPLLRGFRNRLIAQKSGKLCAKAN
jgi:hypothetical protein